MRLEELATLGSSNDATKRLELAPSVVMPSTLITQNKFNNLFLVLLIFIVTNLKSKSLQPKDSLCYGCIHLFSSQTVAGKLCIGKL